MLTYANLGASRSKKYCRSYFYTLGPKVGINYIPGALGKGSALLSGMKKPAHVSRQLRQKYSLLVLALFFHGDPAFGPEVAFFMYGLQGNRAWILGDILG